MEIKTTNNIIDTYDSEFMSQNNRIKYGDVKWVKVEDYNNQMKLIEKWFQEWYEYSWNVNSQFSTEEIKEIKKLIKELKQ